jgi:hypothetical protein
MIISASAKTEPGLQSPRKNFTIPPFDAILIRFQGGTSDDSLDTVVERFFLSLV